MCLPGGSAALAAGEALTRRQSVRVASLLCSAARGNLNYPYERYDEESKLMDLQTTIDAQACSLFLMPKSYIPNPEL